MIPIGNKQRSIYSYIHPISCFRFLNMFQLFCYMCVRNFICAYFLFMMCPLYSYDIIYEHVQLFMCLLFVYDVSTV